MATLVTYFSAEGTTAAVAKEFAAKIGADLFEIVPEQPYTAADIKWTNPLARCNREQIGGKDVPVSGKIDGFEKYDTVYIGFPIWYENAPKVIYTFMQKLKNKVVVPFCTGSEMGQVDQYLSNITDYSVQVMSGRKFDKSVSVEEIKDWVTILSADFDSH